jgi:predicted nucleic acid-binding protein
LSKNWSDYLSHEKNSVNLSYYITLREYGEENAEIYRHTMAGIPVTLIDANAQLTLHAARYKAFHKMSYADAFAAALAKLHVAQLVTGDEEFKQVQDEVKLLWI